MPAFSPLADRLWSKVSPEPNSGCWLWTGFVNPHGYGTIWTGETMRLAHRVSYELRNGTIPDGLDLDHRCRVRSCVNPSHLRPMTRAENIAIGQGIAPTNAAKSHCKYGHEFTPANTKPTRKGRECRECARLRSIEFRKRQKDKANALHN